MQRNGLSAHLTQEKPPQAEQEGWPHSSGLKARRKAGTAHTETVSFRNGASASVFAVWGTFGTGGPFRGLESVPSIAVSANQPQPSFAFPNASSVSAPFEKCAAPHRLKETVKCVCCIAHPQHARTRTQ